MISDAEYEHLMKLAFEGKQSPMAQGKSQELLVLGGLPAAGKTTVLAEHEPFDSEAFVYASPDWVKFQMQNFSPEFHGEASRVNTEIINQARVEGFNLLYDSLLDNYGRAAGTIRPYLAKGGVARVLFTQVGIETSCARALAREVEMELSGKQSRAVPDAVIARSYMQSLPTFLALYEKYHDDPRVEFLLVDNDVDFEQPKEIMEKVEDSEIVYDQERFDALLATPYKKIDGGYYEREENCTEESVHECRPAASARAVALVLQKGIERGGQEMERKVR